MYEITRFLRITAIVAVFCAILLGGASGHAMQTSANDNSTTGGIVMLDSHAYDGGHQIAMNDSISAKAAVAANGAVGSTSGCGQMTAWHQSLEHGLVISASAADNFDGHNWAALITDKSGHQHVANAGTSTTFYYGTAQAMMRKTTWTSTSGGHSGHRLSQARTSGDGNTSQQAIHRPEAYQGQRL